MVFFFSCPSMVSSGWLCNGLLYHEVSGSLFCCVDIVVCCVCIFFLGMNWFGVELVLRREIPMAWGTTIDSLTPEINPFQYAIEIKHLTLKPSDLIPYSGRLK